MCPKVLQRLPKIYTSRSSKYFSNYLSIRSAVLGCSDFIGWPHLNYGAMIERDKMDKYFKRLNIMNESDEIGELQRIEEEYNDDISIDCDESEYVYHIISHPSVWYSSISLPDELDNEWKRPTPWFDINRESMNRVLNTKEMILWIKAKEQYYHPIITDILRIIDPNDWKSYKIGWYLLAEGMRS